VCVCVCVCVCVVCVTRADEEQATERNTCEPTMKKEDYGRSSC
jgi:hypothetical protein